MNEELQEIKLKALLKLQICVIKHNFGENIVKIFGAYSKTMYLCIVIFS